MKKINLPIELTSMNRQRLEIRINISGNKELQYLRLLPPFSLEPFVKKMFFEQVAHPLCIGDVRGSIFG